MTLSPRSDSQRLIAGKSVRKLGHQDGDGATIYKHGCKLGCEGIVSKRIGSPYRAGRSADWLKVKNPKAPAVKREAEEEWR
jgi:ATP-dependent DNA ligase